jgi:RNA polymerase sigma-70 factor, ECF subfamily
MINSALPVSPFDSASAPASMRPWPAVMPKFGDKSAVARAQAGDHQAFSELYSLHKTRVYRICLRMVRSVPLAEDLTQESFLQLYRKIATFQGHSSFSTWLHRLTVNVVLMHLRKKGLSLTSLECTLIELPEGQLRRTFGTLDPDLVGSVDRLAIRRAVEALPPGYRMIFLLHDVEGFEHHEIASRLNCTIGTSKSQLHKARRRLRGALSAESPEESAVVVNHRQHKTTARY